MLIMMAKLTDEEDDNNDDDNKEEPQTNDRLPARGATRQPRSAARTHRVAGEALGGDGD